MNYKCPMCNAPCDDDDIQVIKVPRKGWDKRVCRDEFFRQCFHCGVGTDMDGREIYWPTLGIPTDFLQVDYGEEVC